AELAVAMRRAFHLWIRRALTCLKEPGNKWPYRHAMAGVFPCRRSYDEETDLNPSIPAGLRRLCIGNHAGDRPAPFRSSGVICAVFNLVVDFRRLHQSSEPAVKALVRQTGFHIAHRRCLQLVDKAALVLALGNGPGPYGKQQQYKDAG